jgi:YbbR domain-containing protein
MNPRSWFHNLHWKLLSLVIAAVLWVVFIGSPELVTSVSVPIQYQNMPQGLEMGADTPERVYLEVEGPSARLDAFEASQSAVILNLANVRVPGEFTFTIDQSEVDLPAGLRLVRAVPAQVRLHFERRISAEVSVHVRFSNPPPEGYQVSRMEVRPQTLTIVGPESRVKQIASVETDPIDLSHVVGTAQFRVHTFLADPQVRFQSSPEVEIVVSLVKSVSGGAPPDGGETAIRN